MKYFCMYFECSLCADKTKTNGSDRLQLQALLRCRLLWLGGRVVKTPDLQSPGGGFES